MFVCCVFYCAFLHKYMSESKIRSHTFVASDFCYEVVEIVFFGLRYTLSCTPVDVVEQCLFRNTFNELFCSGNIVIVGVTLGCAAYQLERSVCVISLAGKIAHYKGPHIFQQLNQSNV